MMPALFWPLMLGVLGAVFGSFIAVLAIRWPVGESALKGRSRCDGCGRTLRAAELVPILSWVWVRGRCRTCGARIPPAHLATELLGAGIGIAAGWAAPGWEGVSGAVFGWLLLALGAIDLAAFWLPNALVAMLAAAGLVDAALAFGAPVEARLIGGVAGFGMLWLIAALYRRARGRMGLGGGDPKLFGAIGLWLGWRALPGVLLIACLIGLLVAVTARMRRADRLPLGTLLAVAAYLWWLATAAAWVDG